MPVLSTQSTGINSRRLQLIRISSRWKSCGNCINLMERTKLLVEWGRKNPLKAKLLLLISLWLLTFFIFGVVKLLHWNELWRMPSVIEGIPAVLGSNGGNN